MSTIRKYEKKLNNCSKSINNFFDLCLFKTDHYGLNILTTWCNDRAYQKFHSIFWRWPIGWNLKNLSKLPQGSVNKAKRFIFENKTSVSSFNSALIKILSILRFYEFCLSFCHCFFFSSGCAVKMETYGH